MKRKFFKVLLGVVFILANLGMAEYVKKDNEIYYKYGKEDDSGFKVENVDLNTFKILDDKYAKDSKSVYFLGNKSFEDVDIKTFEVLSDNYSKDNNNVYRPNNEWIRKINGANPKTIKVLSQYYSKDDKNVYVAREIVKGADPQTFRRIPETNYARDKNTLYYYFGDVKNLGKINEKDFKVLDNNLVKNGNEMYYLGEKVNIKNPEKFEPIKISDDKYILYGKDDENIYVVTSDEKYGYFKAIKNADKDTFEVMEKDTRYSKDKNNVYYAGYNVVQLQDVDKDSFVIADENAFSYNKKNVYYAGRKLNDISSNGFKVTRLDNRPNLPINFLNDNKNIYKLIDVFDEETGELKSVKTAVVKNPKVDSKTFELFDHWENYFRDKNNVYYENELYKMSLKKIEGADRNSFKILDSEFSKDKNNVYYYGNKMKGISPDGFEFVGNKFIFENREDFISFLKDKNNVYYLKGKIGKEKYEIIPLNFDSKTFKYSNNGFYELINSNYTSYFQDKNGVYYFNGLAKLTPNNILSKVENADIPSFVQYMAGYAKDKNKVYCGTKEVKGADVESFAAFTIDGEDIIKDKNKIYKYTDSCEQ